MTTTADYVIVRMINKFQNHIKLQNDCRKVSNKSIEWPILTLKLNNLHISDYRNNEAFIHIIGKSRERRKKTFDILFLNKAEEKLRSQRIVRGKKALVPFIVLDVLAQVSSCMCAYK